MTNVHSKRSEEGHTDRWAAKRQFQYPISKGGEVRMMKNGLLDKWISGGNFFHINPTIHLSSHPLGGSEAEGGKRVTYPGCRVTRGGFRDSGHSASVSGHGVRESGTLVYVSGTPVRESGHSVRDSRHGVCVSGHNGYVSGHSGYVSDFSIKHSEQLTERTV